jgi:hypothetical protein
VSLLDKYQIPQTFCYLIFTLAVCLILTFFVPGADFGVFKTPQANDSVSRWILVIGLLLLLLSCLSLIPVFSEAGSKHAPEYFRRSEEFQSHLKTCIQSAKSEIIFWAGNFYMSTNERREDLLARLSDGVNIKYLVFNPTSPVKTQASYDFGENVNQFEKQCEICIQNLLDLRARWEEKKKSSTNKGDLQIRLYTSTPRLRAYFFDPGDDKSFTYVVHFLYKTDSSQLPMFRILNSKEGVFANYLASFNNHWNAGDVITLDDYLAQNQAKVGVRE